MLDERERQAKQILARRRGLSSSHGGPGTSPLPLPRAAQPPPSGAGDLTPPQHTDVSAVRDGKRLSFFARSAAGGTHERRLLLIGLGTFGGVLVAGLLIALFARGGKDKDAAPARDDAARAIETPARDERTAASSAPTGPAPNVAPVAGDERASASPVASVAPSASAAATARAPATSPPAAGTHRPRPPPASTLATNPYGGKR